MSELFAIDGATFDTLDGFFDAFEREVIPGQKMARDFNGLHAVLRGEHGTPNDGFTLIWKNAEVSKEKLSFGETAKFMKELLKTCHPDHREQVEQQIELAESEKGAVIYDWLVEIFRDHSPNGSQPLSMINLILE